ncbi:adhesion G protein-coupled receptor L2 [Caerostris darwini]|uniref:Adhesion G protein-coupled receptor L2 n=1 Tax=Caerostris darwini TaxID=1538125 RepID=A0AAV4MT69_9ARAC|nr:adhesion G protein-coupled receptor L2 [Caerostris darwini]
MEQRESIPIERYPTRYKELPPKLNQSKLEKPNADCSKGLLVEKITQRNGLTLMPYPQLIEMAIESCEEMGTSLFKPKDWNEVREFQERIGFIWELHCMQMIEIWSDIKILKGSSSFNKWVNSKAPFPNWFPDFYNFPGYLIFKFSAADSKVQTRMTIIPERLPYFCENTTWNTNYENLTNGSTDLPMTTTTRIPRLSYCREFRIMYKNFTLIWPKGKLGEIIAISCPRGLTGTVKLKCNQITTRYDLNPVFNCKKLNCSESLAEKVGKESIAEVSEWMRKCINTDDHRVKDAFDVFKRKRDTYFERPSSRDEMKQDMDMALELYNQVIDTESNMTKHMEKVGAFSRFRNFYEVRIETSIELIKETEATAWLLGCLEDEDVAMKKDNLAIEIFELSDSIKRKEMNLSLTSVDIGSVYLPSNLSVGNNTFCKKQVKRGILAVYRNLQNFLRPNNQMEITSRIIGVSLGDSNDTRLLPDEKSIKIILTHPPKPESATPVCVFLNLNYQKSNSPYGMWETEGCRVVRSEIDFTECECNHLTNFAILMDFAGPEFKPEDEFVLNILSSVFCGLSTLSLLLTVIIYLTIKSLRSRRNTITCNLAICLLAMNILVQTGLKRAATTVCKVVSGVLQYCVLSAFFWMLLEGVLLYRMVIQVFQTKKTRIFVLYIIAYGIPFVIVSLSSAMFRDEMIRKKYCWPSKEKGLIWSVLAPVLFIILINFIIFGMTLRAASKIDQFNVGTISFESKKKILRQVQIKY